MWAHEEDGHKKTAQTWKGLEEVAMQGETIGRRGRSMPGMSQCNPGRQKEKVDVGSNAGGPIARQGLCLSFRVGNNFRELWAVGGSI